MPDFKLPLSGDVSQVINPWTVMFNPWGSQFGLININLGKSAGPDIEQAVLEDVASYGRQLGRMGDALMVLLAHFRPERPLEPAESKAIADLRRMLEEIADVRDRHAARNTMRPSALPAG